MYRKYYGLKQKPFELAPVGGKVYLSEGHREALATLRYGVIANKGFLLLTGGVGTGKTTVLNTLLGMVKDKVKVCVLNNPTLSKHEFFSYIAKHLAIPYQKNKGTFILQFAEYLHQYAQEGGKVLLIIDEAQAFPIPLLEEIRLLSNHAGQINSLSIFLIGQPELQEKLSDPQLLPLRQRIGIRHHLEPLAETDVAQYIAYRLNQAGATNTSLFDSGAINTIHKESRGNPRLINIICDHALLSGFNSDLRRITKPVIEECVKEIKLKGEKKLQASDTKSSSNSLLDFFTSKSYTIATVSGILLLAIAAIVLYQFVPQTFWDQIVDFVELTKLKIIRIING